jgi:serine/threonine protein kinase
MKSSAQKLVGLTLDDGWEVIELLPISEYATGGNFSVGYQVRSPAGKLGFLKALDYSKALRAPDPAIAFQKMTETFNFERDVLNKCRDKNLDRIVAAISEGKVTIPRAADGGVVQYLIFELADGDIRKHIGIAESFDLAWTLRSLHHITTGLWQLHSLGIAHQDLKPSNVLVFDKSLSKIADLGRAAQRGYRPPHHDYAIAGDPSYAPPELLYGQVDPEWNCRRFGCDAYLLGSMVTFFFMGVDATTLMFKELQPSFHYKNWGGTYQEVLPFIRYAFDNVVMAFNRSVTKDFRDELTAIVQQLCEPDPQLRGHPLNRRTGGNQYSLERYVSRFNLLASRKEQGLIWSFRL